MRGKYRKSSKDSFEVPVIFPLTYLEFAAEQGFSRDAVLAQAGLPANGAWLGGQDMALVDYERLLAGLSVLLPDQGLGFEVGWRLPPTAFGGLGQIFLSCPTLGDALEQCQRFWHLYGVGLTLSVEHVDGYCSIGLDILHPVHRRYRQAILECALTCIYRCLTALMGRRHPDGEMWLDWPEPSYRVRMSECIGRVIFNAPKCQYRLPDHCMHDASVLSSVIGYRNAIEQCKREMALRGGASQGISGLVQQQLVLLDAGYPCFDQIAERLRMTPRTLRRRLQEEGTRFGWLLIEAQRRDAMRLLEQTELEVQQIALILGYAEPANFTRAFQQWCSTSPSQHRQARKKKAD